MIRPAKLAALLGLAAILAAPALGQVAVTLGAGDGSPIPLETARRCAGFYAVKEAYMLEAKSALNPRDRLVSQAWAFEVSRQTGRTDADLGREVFEDARKEVIARRKDIALDQTAIILTAIADCQKLETIKVLNPPAAEPDAKPDAAPAQPSAPSPA